MIGIGTLINTAAVVVGGLLGLLFKNGIRETKPFMQACGIATIFIGVSGVLSKMLFIENGNFFTQGTMLLIFSMIIGTVIGEAVHLEERTDAVGEHLKKVVKQEHDNKFVDGFVSLSLIICIGAMAIVGSVEDGINGDYSMLAAKSVLDGIMAIILASTYGIGAVFAAIPLFIYQGSITLAASFFGEFISDTLINEMTLVGSTLIFCVGINLAFGKKFRVGNMLPAIAVPIIYESLLHFFK